MNANGRAHMGLEVCSLDGAMALAAAVLAQALKDARSPREAIRHEAEAFLASESVGWWDEALGLNGALRRQMQAALRPRGGA
jgi:hypothetical protein